MMNHFKADNILIDGLNLLYKFPDLLELMYLKKLSEARERLLEILNDYVGIINIYIRVVFDGKKNHGLDIKTECNGAIEVYYSQQYTADHLIKQFIKNNLQPKLTTVVTSDKDILKYVKKHKSKIMTSENFADHINNTLNPPVKEELPEAKLNPELSEEEISLWENHFNSINQSENIS